MPLSNFQVTRTRSIEEIRDALAHVYIKPALQPVGATKTLDAMISHCRLNDVSLGYVKYGASVRAEFPTFDRFIYMTRLWGKGRITSRNATATLDADRGALISPGDGYRADYDEDSMRMVVQFDARALTAKLAALIGRPVDEPLCMDLQAELTDSGSKALRDYLSALVNTLSSVDRPLPHWWVAQTEQLLMILYLVGHRHNYSRFLGRSPPDAGVSLVRRTEEYIEANWRESPSLETLAEVSGVSAFSLYRTFKSRRGYSPFEFAARIRSRHKE